jgi:protein TonB
MPEKVRKSPLAAAAPAAWSADAARDRLSSTVFIAALVHGILILGVTFTADRPPRDPAPTSLDVVIVARDYAKRAAPRNPALLAEQNLVGRGNGPLDARLRTAAPASPDPAFPGPDQAGDLAEPRRAGEAEPAEQRLTATAPSRDRVLTGDPGAAVRPMRQALMVSNAEPSELVADPDTETVIPDANPRELMVSANTRESSIAGYLNTWKSKVERIGTLNFPNASQLATIRTYPVLEVAVTADGDLKEVVVRSSSGYRNLDQAAMEILRIAAPFEPFPEVLRADYDVLRFAYEWRFGAGGGIASGRITAVSGS